MSFSDSQIDLFKTQGVFRITRGIPGKLAETTKRAVFAELDRLKLRTGGKISAADIQKMPIFQQTGVLGNKLKLGVPLADLFPASLVSDISQLAKTPFKSTASPQLLLSLPHKTEWSLNNLNWHLDLIRPEKDEVPGVQVFVLIDEVKPKGGATLALAGSHKLAQNILRNEPSFRELFGNSISNSEKFFKTQMVNGIEVFIVEMVGNAGDVYVMDMRVLHSPSVNATKNIRMMATNRYLR